MAITTKAALAAELKISKARVSQYVKAGLPVRSDGKLNREQALNWIKRTQSRQAVEVKGVAPARKPATDRPRNLWEAPPSFFDPEVQVACSIMDGPVRSLPKRQLSLVPRGSCVILSFIASIALDDAASEALAKLGFEDFAGNFCVGELCGLAEFPEPAWKALAERTGASFDEAVHERLYAKAEALAWPTN